MPLDLGHAPLGKFCQEPDRLSIVVLYLHPAAVSTVFSIRGSEPLCSFVFCLTFV